jgi:hypothetical protein
MVGIVSGEIFPCSPDITPDKCRCGSFLSIYNESSPVWCERIKPDTCYGFTNYFSHYGDDFYKIQYSCEYRPTVCPWSAWAPTSACDCSTLTQPVRRQCSVPLWPYVNSTQPCCCPVNGGWSEWTTTGVCSTECNDFQNTIFKTRTCTTPVPLCGGITCIGESIEMIECPYIHCNTTTTTTGTLATNTDTTTGTLATNTDTTTGTLATNTDTTTGTLATNTTTTDTETNIFTDSTILYDINQSQSSSGSIFIITIGILSPIILMTMLILFIRRPKKIKPILQREEDTYEIPTVYITTTPGDYETPVVFLCDQNYDIPMGFTEESEYEIPMDNSEYKMPVEPQYDFADKYEIPSNSQSKQSIYDNMTC